MVTKADAIAAKFAAASVKIADAFHPDTYRLVRRDKVRDGQGAWTETDTYPETGRCRLDITQRQAPEAVNVNQYISNSTPYEVEIPKSSAIRGTDRIEINGNRIFDVESIYNGGEFEMFMTIAVNEILEGRG